MTRLFLASSAILSALAVIPYAGETEKPPQKGALPRSNRIYVKIILPTDPAKKDKDRPVVESWIAEQLKKRGQSKFTAATAWVPLDDVWVPFNKKGKKWWEYTDVWDGKLDGTEWTCPVAAKISERADGRIRVIFGGGWAPAPAQGDVSVKDEPGSREIAAVEREKTEEGMPYVAVLIGPPPAIPAALFDDKK